MKPLEIINSLRESDKYIEMIYLQGGCYKFHLFLKKLFTGAIPYTNTKRDHVISRIGGRFYDITGEVDNHSFHICNEQEIKMCEEWSFSKNMALRVNECPACGEPICV
jgi:hypothetical protein